MKHSNFSYRSSYSKPKTPIVIVLLVVVALLALSIVFVLTFVKPASQKPVIDSGATPISDSSKETPASIAPKVAEDIIFTLAGSRDTYVLKGEQYLEPGAYATQKDVGDITSSVTISGKVNTDVSGDYKIIYTATNSNGEKATTERTVHVVDAFEQNATTIPVFMYHYVYSADNPPESLNNNYILDTKLAQECAYLKEQNYYFPSFEELRGFVDGTHSLPAKSCILTFDDGELGFLQTGIPVLNQYEVPATSFVVAKDAGQNCTTYANPYVQFQSHSFNMHRPGGGKGQGGIIHALSKDQIVEDIELSNEVTPGHKAKALAYPFGDNHEGAWNALSESEMLCAFTVKNDRIKPGDNPYALNRVRMSGEYSVDTFKSLVAPM